MTPEQQKIIAIASARARLKAKEATAEQPAPDPQAQGGEPYSGTLLPFTKDESGNVSFDSDAGIVGMIKRGFSVPGDVMTGKLDLNSPEATFRLLEAAAMMSPVGAASRVAGSVFAPKSAYQTVTPQAPTREALKEATDAGYKQVSDLDVRYAPGAVEKMAVDLENSLNEKGLISGLKGVKDVHTLLQTLKGGPEDSYVKMASLDAFRQRLGEIAGSPKNKSPVLQVRRSELLTTSLLRLIRRILWIEPLPVDKGWHRKDMDTVQPTQRQIEQQRKKHLTLCSRREATPPLVLDQMKLLNFKIK